jgi:histone acetyltransferase (RNA polymerase elongator complex component)
MKWYIPIFSFTILLAACGSTRAAVPSPGESAGEYRELQGELYQQQADIAVTGQRIEDQGRGLVENLTRLEEVIAATPDAGETDRLYWLSQARAARADAEVHQADIEDLNRQLAAERETIKKQDQKFNDYEIEMVKRLSDKDTENAQLMVENKAVKGQRNTFLAILITAGVVVLLFIVFKVLRAIKIIPI